MARSLVRRGFGADSADDAVGTAIADIVAAFIRHPEWPQGKFESRQELLAYAIASSRYAATRLARAELAVPPDLPAALAVDGPGQLGGSAADRLIELVGPINATVLRAREMGLSIDAISRLLALEGYPESSEEIAERMLLLIEEYPLLSQNLAIDDEESVRVLRDLVRLRTTTKISERDVALVANRLARRPYDLVGDSTSAENGGVGDSGDHPPLNANALRQRMYRLARRDAWIATRLASRDRSNRSIGSQPARSG